MDGNECEINTRTRNNWRARLVPAAAVIPAPIVYIRVVAVKKLVVVFHGAAVARPRFRSSVNKLVQTGLSSDRYLEKIRVFMAGKA